MKLLLKANRKTGLVLGIVLLVGLYLRLYGTSWDSGFYLNPDERFLTMVLYALKLPTNLFQYFDPLVSPLNPVNHNFRFFVYGHFPISLLKLLAVIFNSNNYASFFRLSRPVTALVDTSVIAAVFLIAQEFLKKEPHRNQIGILAALIYALMVLPIQQAHFFTTDAYVSALAVWSVYGCLRARTRSWAVILAAVCFGLGLASKINVLAVLPLILALLPRQRLVVFGLISYITLRLADPYIFASHRLWDPRLSTLFIENLKQLNSLGKNIFFPPAIQWVGTGFFFPIKNIFFFGAGPVFFLLFAAGSVLFFKTRRFKNKLGWLIIGWMVILYTFQSLQMAKALRYFLLLYPYLALLAGFCLYQLSRPWRAGLLFAGSLWTISFLNIYSVPHSRIAASQWINTHVVSGSSVSWEYWDDPLPLYTQAGKIYRMVKLDLYEPDSVAKWRLLAKKLHHLDYIVLSSNRLHANLSKVPELYPITSRYYRLLMANKLGFRKIKEFHVFPTLGFGKYKLEFNDQWAEESFTVYDHPQVLVYHKQPGFSVRQFLKKLHVQ